MTPGIPPMPCSAPSTALCHIILLKISKKIIEIVACVHSCIHAPPPPPSHFFIL